MRLGRLTERVASWSETVGVLAVLVMLVLTVVDVIGAKLFLRPLRGSTELVGFSQLIAVASGMTMAFVAGRHIALDLLVSKLPASVQRGARGLGAVLCLGLFGIVAWQSFLYGRSLAVSGQMSSTADVPFYPFAYALGGFAVITVLYFVAELWHVVRGEGSRS